MSLRYEQYNSLKITREYLRDLLDSKKRPQTVFETKERAYNCLKHFPFLEESGKPIFSKDNFSKD